MIELNTNYHTHSLYCDGKEPLSAFVTAAEKLHYTQLGFSSHAPVPFENDFGIKENEIDPYCQEIDELQQHTPVTLLKSLECDFIPGQSKPFDAFREEHHLDYIIGGVHLVLPPHSEGLWFIDGSKREVYDDGLDRLFGHNIRQAVTCFWEQTFEMIETEHFEIIAQQRKRLGTSRGFVAVKPNCSIQSYAPAIFALREFGPREVVATTYQAISGAGKTFKDWPEMVGNIIPYIGGEEEKSEQEPLRIFGKVVGDHIEKASRPLITTQCIRVPVLNGHTAAVFVNFDKKPSKEEIIDRWIHFRSLPQELNLPSAPKQFIQYLEDDNRPQVALDVDYERGMGVSMGRLREDSLFDYKFVGLSHNTIRGAAGGAVLCAELLTAQNYITKK